MKKVRFSIGIVFLYFGFVCCFFLGGCGEEKLSFYPAENAEETAQMQSEERAEDLSETPSLIYIDVSGAILHPGVYELEEGSRVFQAVEAAGGFAENAFREKVNLACILRDEQQVYIPYRQEELSEQAENDTEWNVSEDGKVNLNDAELQDLVTLTGIGETRALAILEYRKEHGTFNSVEEIMNVQGIKEGTFAKIKDEIVVR